jgi:hypothetical protein
MGDAVEREVVDAFVVVGDADHVAAEVERRFGGLVDRVQGGLVDAS